MSVHKNRKTSQSLKIWGSTLTNTETATRRVSVRKVAIKYGVPAGAVIRAIDSGELSAVMIRTPSGQERLYICEVDAANWIESLRTDRTEIAQ
jgi:hypothetical protein